MCLCIGSNFPLQGCAAPQLKELDLNIYAKRYSDTLRSRRKLTSRVILLHDNARTHVPHTVTLDGRMK